MAKSIAQIIADLPAEEQAAILAGVDPQVLLYDWKFWGRPEQHTPPGNWNIHLLMAGRGFGKTRTAAEFIREQAMDLSEGPKRIGIVTRVSADGRDVMVEGPAGIMNICPPGEMPLYEPSKRRLTWPNGAMATLYSADEPSLLRGPQFHVAVGDEAAAWRRLPDDSGLTAWDNLRIATRLGRNPRILLTTTPKRVPMMYALLEEHVKTPEKVIVTRGKTSDNSGNLHAAYLDAVYGIYEGTALGRQELEGEMLDAVEGALWNLEEIDEDRQFTMPGTLPLRLIGVDPSVAENPKDECGIVVVGSTAEPDLFRRTAWVMEDASVHGAPQLWAARVVEMAKKYGCPVVAEVNQGGALVKNAIHQIDPTVHVLEVHSKQGKQLRAEPITLAYQQHRVHHYGAHPELEDQMTMWVPGEGKSPDRVDALVHALTALLIKPPMGFTGSKIQAKSYADRRLNTPSLRSSRRPGIFRAR